MFPNNLDKQRHPIENRWWGVWVGTFILLATAAALVSPRTLPFSFPIVFLAILIAAERRQKLRILRSPLGGGSLLAIAFFGYAGFSGLWAQSPLVPIGHALAAGLCFAGAGVMAHALLCEPRRNIFHIGEGLWIGLFAGLAYLFVELLSHQTIKLHMYNAFGFGPGNLRPPSFFVWKDHRLLWIAPDDLKRSIAPVTLFMWSGLLAIRGTAPWRHARWMMPLLFILAASVVFSSVHSTSKGALIGGALIFSLASWRRDWSERLLRFGWVASCLAIIPMALFLHRINLQSAPWVQSSMQHRIVAWNYTAQQTLKAPVLGIGAGMMYELFGSQVIENEPEAYDPRLPHAHNIYLQTWFELGVIGAAFLTLIGLAILDRIHRLGPRVAPYGQATFASATIIASSSYGMWQAWFVSMFAFAVMLFAIAVRTTIDQERTPGLTQALE